MIPKFGINIHVGDRLIEERDQGHGQQPKLEHDERNVLALRVIEPGGCVRSVSHSQTSPTV